MSEGAWSESDESLAEEAFAVLIKRENVSRIYTKKILVGLLKKHDISLGFLKLCAEHDDSIDLKVLRKGLALVLKSHGVATIAKRTGISRVSLYRMLSADGNPRLNNFVTVCRVLGLRLWVVEEEFNHRGKAFERPKDKKAIVWDQMMQVSTGRRKPRIDVSIDYDGKDLPKRN